MLEGSLVVVIVPAFQEEEHVGRVVATMPAFVDHVVVVDDGSSDATSARAREASALSLGAREADAGARGARVRVVRHAERRGVGAAIATGYREALALGGRPTDALCVMAGDGQMDPDELARVAGPIARGEADYVKGDRFGDPSVRSRMGLPRWVGGQVFSRLTSAAIGQRISDSQCGFTALARSAAARLDLDGLWRGFGYPNDLLGQLAARGLRVAEVPVTPIYGAESSKLRLRHLPPIFYLIARAALRRRRRGRGRADVTRTDDDDDQGLRPDASVSS
jgi:glycosyltransferase involved in cell wall biosynthesis